MENYNSIWVIDNTSITRYLTKDNNLLPSGDTLNEDRPFDFILATIDSLKSNLPHLFVISITGQVKSSLALIQKIKTITPHYKVDIKVISSILTSEDKHYLSYNLNVGYTQDNSVYKSIIELLESKKRNVNN